MFKLGNRNPYKLNRMIFANRSQGNREHASLSAVVMIAQAFLD